MPDRVAVRVNFNIVAARIFVNYIYINITIAIMVEQCLSRSPIHLRRALNERQSAQTT